MPQQSEATTLDLSQWVPIKERGALVKTGHVYRSPDGMEVLRTGKPEVIAEEAEFAQEVFRRGFPVPQVTGSGLTSEGLGYFRETSVGEQNFGQLFREAYAAEETIPDELFDAFATIGLKFVEAQLKLENRQSGQSQLREGIQLANVLEENPDISPDLTEQAISKAEGRIAELPLVLSHGDLTPFNTLQQGVIDFEHKFIAPAGYDAISYVTFHRFWSHPKPDGTGTMRHWEFSRKQMAEYLTRLDSICEQTEVPAISQFFDDYLMLKSIWALSYEKTDVPDGHQARRWQWRKKVALYCMEQYLAGNLINSEAFREIGLAT